MLRLATAPEDPAESLEDLLGPPQMRPGELHERYPAPVSAAFARAAAAHGIATSLAVSVVCERRLAISELECLATPATGVLDDAARRQAPTRALSRLTSRYARTLVAALSGHPVGNPASGPAVVSMRLANRLRATDVVVDLHGDEIEIALWWELASVVSGATILEWALHEALQDATVYDPAAARPDSAASSTAL